MVHLSHQHTVSQKTIALTIWIMIKALAKLIEGRIILKTNKNKTEKMKQK